MRKLLDARLLFALCSVAAIGVWAACGGSDGQDVVETPDSGPGPTPTDDPPDPKPPVVEDSGPKDSGTTNPKKPFDAGPTVIIDGGALYEGGIACFSGGEVEEEPNDDKPSANILRPVRCGAILVPDAGTIPDGGESDWLTFQVADASTGFELYYEGQVHVIVETAGHTTKDISIPGQSLDLVKGQPYHVQIRSNDGKTQFWKLVIREDKPDGG